MKSNAKKKEKEKEKRWEGEFNIKDEKLHSKVKKWKKLHL